MKFLSALRSIPKKIQQNGFVWLYKRVKLELLAPTFSGTKYAVKHMENLRALFRSNKIATQTNMVSPDTLLVVYDLNFESITFDFAHFLAAAETFGKKHGKSKLFVIFVKQDPSVQGSGDYLSVVTKDSQQWRFTNIVVQLAQLYPACTGYSVVPHNSEILNFIPNKLIYPAGYSATYKPLMDYAEIFPLLDLKLFSGFHAPKQGLDYILKWQKLNNIVSPMVVITLRQYGYDVTRNSNTEEWVKFAHWVKGQGFTPIIIPDTDACWVQNNLLDDFVVFNEPCWNLGLRMAINELAFVNLFYINGPASICTLSKKCRSIIFFPVIEESTYANSTTVEKFGVINGQRRYNFAEAHQFLSWKHDSFENIKDEFMEFQKYCPLD